MPSASAPSNPSPFDPRAEALFVTHLNALQRGEASDFEALCRAHPELEGDLRRQSEVHELAQRLLGCLDDLPPRPVSERLRERYGDGVDPGVSLSAEPKAPTGPPSKLFERLRGEGPRGTRYRLLGEVARGGMGAILEVWDSELRRKLAMKVILGRGDRSSTTGDTPDVDPRTLGRFLDEAQITGQLDHPGIVPVHELGLDATGRVYFTMRLVKGEDLKTIFEHVRSGHEGWSQVRALNVMLRVCEALAFAHSKQVIHRDLKPANIMVGRFGEVYVMDWGLARLLGREDKHDLRLRSPDLSARSLVKTERHDGRDQTVDSPLLTMDGDVVGTPSYMPPEQARGSLEQLGPHSDVYSIGAMLYQLVTGRMPYVPEGARVSPHTILAAVLNGPPQTLESLAPRTPPELAAICAKAMAREIPARYPTTQALAQDLRAYLEGRVVAAYETGTWAETRKWVQRNKPLAASLAAAALAVVTGLVAFGLKTREAHAVAVQATELRDAAVARADALWTIQELVDFRRESSDWEFAWALQRPAIEWWLETARRLVYGHPATESAGQAQRPSLEDHQRLLAEIRTSAQAPTPEQVDATGQRIAWSFEDREKRWWNEQLQQLVADLRELRDRVAIAEQCALSPNARRLWSEARIAIQSHPKYGGLTLSPQLFLQPLGPDPESGLWEFSHLLTGESAVRSADGHLTLTDTTGLVFVLLPGGRVPVEDGEVSSPFNEVDLTPFLLSKYETTQGQRSYVSSYDAERVGNNGAALHPAYFLDWDDCQQFFKCMPGWLRLPSEAQWEFGCRAETTTPWWTGSDPESLRGAAHINFDSVDRTQLWTMPIGALRANPFGLHDVHGNLREWCQDRGDEDVIPRPRDGLREGSGTAFGIVRGGGFGVSAYYARSGYRGNGTPEVRRFGFGQRPASPVTP
ncbi:MAG: bifunctional serine/threonine-protein kinase/formylglycine-generating enzyme family protein [Planctomycetota bacterium]